MLQILKRCSSKLWRFIYLKQTIVFFFFVIQIENDRYRDSKYIHCIYRHLLCIKRECFFKMQVAAHGCGIQVQVLQSNIHARPNTQARVRSAHIYIIDFIIILSALQTHERTQASQGAPSQVNNSIYSFMNEIHAIHE